MALHWGRVTVLAIGVALLAASSLSLVLVAETGVWAVLGLVAAALAVAVLPAVSGVERHVRPVDLTRR